MAQIAQRMAGQENVVERDVYIHAGYRKDDIGNGRYLRKHTLNCFRDSDCTQRYPFYYHHFFAFQQPHAFNDFFMKLPRVLFLGEYRVFEDQNADYQNYFNALHEYGYHLFMRSAGELSYVLTYGRSVNRNFISTLNQAPIGDIFPRFHHNLDQNPPRLNMKLFNIGRKYSLRGFNVPANCDPSYWPYFEHTNDKYRTLLRGIRNHANAFGVYVRIGAKLLLSELCRRCEITPNVRSHHVRTVVMSGGFVFMEGEIVFQFATNSQAIGGTTALQSKQYTKQELELIADLNITAGTITDHQTPIFFLNPIERSQHGSLCWSLQFNRIPDRDYWALILPQNGSFEVQPFVTGMCGVIVGQNAEPWYESGDRYIDRIPGYHTSPHLNENILRDNNINDPNNHWAKDQMQRHGMRLTVQIGNTRPPLRRFRFQSHTLIDIIGRFRSDIRYARLRNYVYKRLPRTHHDRSTGNFDFEIVWKHYPRFLQTVATVNRYQTDRIGAEVWQYNDMSGNPVYVLCLTAQYVMPADDEL